jgi:hypothetical protein
MCINSATNELLRVTELRSNYQQLPYPLIDTQANSSHGKS